ncbi:MAG: hypothetical protein NZZ41_03780 [Candidatus Dojkabacteria bacterium]|nr:hypothetical protein [Candidatus Dojkabacteria bacterium]
MNKVAVKTIVDIEHIVKIQKCVIPFNVFINITIFISQTNINQTNALLYTSYEFCIIPRRFLFAIFINRAGLMFVIRKNNACISLIENPPHITKYVTKSEYETMSLISSCGTVELKENIDPLSSPKLQGIPKICSIKTTTNNLHTIARVAGIKDLSIAFINVSVIFC